MLKKIIIGGTTYLVSSAEELKAKEKHGKVILDRNDGKPLQDVHDFDAPKKSKLRQMLEEGLK